MKTLTLIKTDLKNVLRDPSLVVIVILPVLLIILLRIAPSFYEPYVPEMITYRPLILGTFCLLISALSGFLLAFVMLDEKDQKLFDVFNVMPFRLNRLIRLRIVSMMVTGFVFCALLIVGSDLVQMNILQVLTLSLLCSLSGPANTLLIVSLAGNKIEGVTYFKVLNMIIMAPMVGVFIAGTIRYLLGIFPFFWVFMSFMKVNEPLAFYLHAGIGILCNIAYLAGSYFLFLRMNR